tara:strand:+ start:161 stop:1417 length:1257 start_codon:yes stop_codon:yes gene_type:complete
MASTQFSAKIEISRSFEKLMGAEVVRFTTLAVKALADKYNFKANEAIEMLGLSDIEVARKTGGPGGKAKTTKAKEPKRDAPKCVLPFCGTCVPDWCHGVRLNHNLYTQCTMGKEGTTDFCKTCNKQAAANATGKPTYGTIEDRIAAGADYKDPKGKKPVNYGNVMKKLDITREAAEVEAKRWGLVIPEDQFEEVKRKQGRPKTKVATSDTESEGEPKAPKKRGRPKKVKTVVEDANAGDDLIAGLVAAAKAEPAKAEPAKAEPAKAEEAAKTEEAAKPIKKAGRPKVTRTPEEEAAHKAKLAENRKKKAAAKKEQEAAEAKLAAEAKAASEKAAAEAKAKAEAEMTIESLEEDEDEAEDVESDEDESATVEEFEFEGKTYYKEQGGKNRLFDAETEEPIGKFNEETQKIEPLDDEDED